MNFFYLSPLGPDGPWVDFSLYVLVLVLFCYVFVQCSSGSSMIISFL